VLTVGLNYLVDGHVHPDEPLVGHLVRALLAEAQRRVNVLQQLHGLRVVNCPTKKKLIRIDYKTILRNYFVSLFASI